MKRPTNSRSQNALATIQSQSIVKKDDKPKMPTQIGGGDKVLTAEGKALQARQMVSDLFSKQGLIWAKSANAAHVTFLLDKSASMAIIVQQTIDGFNDYVSALKRWDKIVFTLAQFDSVDYEITHNAIPISYVTKLDQSSYSPRGGTPLYVSIIRTILDKEKQVLEQGGKPAVVITIQTDGEDSNGNLAELQECKRQIARVRQAYGWQFQFLGVGIDAYQLSTTLGIAPLSTMAYDPDRSQDAFSSAGNRAVSFITGRAKDAGFSQQDRIAAGDTKYLTYKKP